MEELRALLDKLSEYYPKGSDSSQVITSGMLKQILKEVIREADEAQEQIDMRLRNLDAPDGGGD